MWRADNASNVNNKYVNIEVYCNKRAPKFGTSHALVCLKYDQTETA